MIRGLGTLSKAMLLGFLRDKTALFFSILFPLVFLVLFGGLFEQRGAARVKVAEVGAVTVLDDIPAEARGELATVLEIERSDDLAGALARVRAGEVSAAVEQRGEVVLVHYSAVDQVRTGTVRSVMQSLVEQSNLAATGQPARVRLDAAQVEDESLRAVQFIAPGLLGWAVATGATFGAAMTLVAWRKKLILRRLRLSPVRPPAIVAARVGVSVGIGLLQTALLLGVASLPVFGLQLSGYWWMAVPTIVIGTLAFLSIGLVAGAVARTEEAAIIATNIVVLPMAFLSGSFFPLDNAPQWVRTAAEVLPLKHLNTAMQDVLVRGRTPLDILPELGLLLGFAAVMSLVAVRFFRWEAA
jgi:ABC-2 type transport system permease protein